MRVRSSLVFVVAFFAAWALALAPRAARAQTTTTGPGPSVTGIIGVVQRLEPITKNYASADATGADPHPSGVLVNVINFEDCQSDLVYEFELGISSLNSGYNLNVWAGTADCTQLTNRQQATAVCWPVSPFVTTNSNPFTIKIRMRDIVSQAFLATHVVSYVGAPTAVSGDNQLCQSQPNTGATNIQLYFFFADAAQNAVGNAQPYPVTVDMRAGDAQGDISLGVGENLLIVNIPPTTDTDTQGWNVYCDPPPGKESTVATVPIDAATNGGLCLPDTSVATPSDDSGGDGSDDGAADAGDSSGIAVAVDSAVPVVLDDAGGNPCGVAVNDAGIPSPGGCSASNVLVPGGTSSGVEIGVDESGAPIYAEAGTVTSTETEGGVASAFTGGVMRLMPSAYLCGTGSVSATQVNVLGLKDGVYYNIAVGATDAVGNVGPLSNVPCGEPVPVNDFWKVYYEAGGRAGGGFCSAEGVGMPVGTGGLGALMVASMVAMVRRRRRK